MKPSLKETAVINPHMLYHNSVEIINVEMTICTSAENEVHKFSNHGENN